MTRQTTSPIDALGRVDLFAGLTRRQLATVAGAVREHHFRAGDEIVAEGDSSGRFYLILHGTVTVNVHGEEVATLSDGQYFGEIAVIDRGERSAQVVATTEVDACSLASFNFRALLHEHHDLSYLLLLAMCARLRRAESDPVVATT